jgi:putative tryptophan/tyrosine transport system substrate-binding protein
VRRRDFLAAIVASPSLNPAFAQSRVRVALLGGGTARSSAIFVDGLRQGLQENGLEPRDYDLDLRWAEGDYARFPDIVADVLKDQPTAILANTIAAIRAAKHATSRVPCPSS